ncbi:MAG: DNA mismatch repair protein MutS [Clostridiaceae bacterium]|jgi:DNA mismatch repair protein MutS|nr:DNA mismatch repair protein MutS [Clostridiaceae bacterium]
MEIIREKLVPMMRQYFKIKDAYPDAILLYRLGDFYEMFFDDAVTASRILDLTLTARDCGLSERAPMCGVPYHAVETYIKKLIEAGFKAAVCEQLTDPKESKGMIERDVVRVITPGTVMEDGILDEKKNNYIAAVFLTEKGCGAAWADISTGEFYLTENTADDRNLSLIEDILTGISPAEIISNDVFAVEAASMNSFKAGRLSKPEAYQASAFLLENAEKRILTQLGAATLDAFGFVGKRFAIAAAGALVDYLLKTQKRSLAHISAMKYTANETCMVLDGNTRRNLELTETMRDRKRSGSLLGVLDKTKTAAGARTLRKWLEQPLQDCREINARLDAVGELVSDVRLRADVGEGLSGVRDLERLAGRIAFGSLNPKDCLAILDTLTAVPELKKTLRGAKSAELKALNSKIIPSEETRVLLSSAIDPNAPALIKDGGFIRTGFLKELDDYKNARSMGKEWLANLEANEREATGIRTLKISYNHVFGYYIEVSKSFMGLVPYRYQRKQTLSNGERYITAELKEIEEKILGAEESALKLELRIFAEIKEKLTERISEFQSTARALGATDALRSLAETAYTRKYVRPNINPKISGIAILEGRHPVVEAQGSVASYVPNDTDLSLETRTMVITGPNMAGKSTYMRQVALIVLMAHIGSFVPAGSADISLTDRIFTRIGASDDLTGGQSTFMVEMVEVATILNNATDKSLLILDEIGRGTSTIDGLSIAWAVMEGISKTLKAKTLFATHFHDLTELESVLDGVKNYRILVKEIDDSVVFLHKIVRGGANKSYGVEVASLAGVPKEVVARAKEIMAELERSSKFRDTNEIMLKAAKQMKTKQVSLFDETIDTASSEVMAILKDVNPDTLTPIQALTILSDLAQRAKSKPN